MKKALHVKTDGRILEIDLEPNSLDALQSAVGGLVQAIDLSEFTLWCNDEGKILNLPHNPIGQALWTYNYGNTDYIVGDVVITQGYDETDVEGDNIGLTSGQIHRLRTFAEAVRRFVEPRIEVL